MISINEKNLNDMNLNLIKNANNRASKIEVDLF